jgi:hypothetical protein
MTTYRIQYFARDVEKYSARVQTDDIHDEVWDIISDAVEAVNPRDQMSVPNVDFSRALCDRVEFDEFGFCTIVDDVMITANKE